MFVKIVLIELSFMKVFVLSIPTRLKTWRSKISSWNLNSPVICTSSEYFSTMHEQECIGRKILVFIDTCGFDADDLIRVMGYCKNSCMVIIDEEGKWARTIICESEDHKIIDYTCDEISKELLLEILERGRKYYELNKIREKKFVTLWNNGQKMFIDVNNIVRLEAFGSYTRVYHAENEFLVTRCLKNVLHDLPKYFVRIHRSFAIHLDYIEAVYGNQVFLTTGESITVSRSGRKNLNMFLN